MRSAHCPGGNDLAPAPQWLNLADAFWAASTDRPGGNVGMPTIRGIDAVYGHSNIIGATLFPHNIALGAANDPTLMERLGAVTAREIRVTGQPDSCPETRRAHSPSTAIRR